MIYKIILLNTRFYMFDELIISNFYCQNILGGFTTRN